MISGEIYRVIYFLAKKPTFDECLIDVDIFVSILIELKEFWKDS